MHKLLGRFTWYWIAASFPQSKSECVKAHKRLSNAFSLSTFPLWLVLYKGKSLRDNGCCLHCALQKDQVSTFSRSPSSFSLLFSPLSRSRWRGGTRHSPGQTAVLLQGRFSRRGPVHWVVKEEVAQTRVRLCQPSPQVIEHALQGDHSSVLASTAEKSMS